MSGVRVILWNAQGIYNKANEFAKVLSDEDIDIACVCETHLSTNRTLIDFPQYNVIRLDRQSHMGGLLILIRKDLKYREVPSAPCQLVEHQMILVEGKTPFLIINAYLPGGARVPIIRQHYDNDLDKLFNYGHPIFFVGDLNSRHTSWNCKKNNSAGKILFSKLQRKNLIVAFPKDPTYIPMSAHKTPSTIDIVVTDAKIGFSRPYSKTILNSDHVPVIFEIDSQHTKHPIKKEPRRNFYTANWMKFRQLLDKDLESCRGLLNLETLDRMQIDTLINKLTDSTVNAMNRSVPLVNVTKNGLFYSEEIGILIRCRNFYRRRYSRTHQEKDRQLYLFFDRSKKQEIINREKKFNENRMEKFKSDRNGLFKAIRQRKRTQLPQLNGSPGKDRAVCDIDKAELLRGHFSKMHENTMANNDLVFTLGVDSRVSTFLKNTDMNFESNLTSHEVVEHIKSLKNNKAPGPDGIPAIVVKNLSHEAIELYTHALRSCLNIGYFPDTWKKAIATPVPKPGKDPRDKNAYRPISQLNHYSKILEKIINKRFKFFINDKNILPDFQFGFRPGHSTTHPLFDLFKTIKTGFRNKKSTAVLSFDIEKAFDRTWHNGLIFKMIVKDFPKYLIKIIDSFIKDRQFSVRVGDKISTCAPVPWGVPQGSVLSPSLYTFYISDIPMTTDALIRLFADDSAVVAQDKNINIITRQITDTAEELLRYYHKWKIKINADKTTLTFFSYRTKNQIPKGPLTIYTKQKSNPKLQPLKIKGDIIEWQNELKYLGMTFDKRLTMKTHITNTLTKMDNAIRILYPFISRSSTLNHMTKVSLYKIYLQPILLYGGPVMRQVARSNLTLLQRKQNKILRMLLGVPWDTPSKVLQQVSGTSDIITNLDKQLLNFLTKCELSDNNIIKSLCTT